MKNQKIVNHASKRGGLRSVNINDLAWDDERFRKFAAEIDEVKAELEAAQGSEDIQYFKKIKNISRGTEALGRFLIHVSLDPFTWSLGVISLWIHKQIECVEVGHYALHGVWDRFPELSKYHSKNFTWKAPAEEESWKHGHNHLHHQYTNVVGKDPDVNYGTLRTSEYTQWGLYHAIQILQFFLTAPFFMEVINVYNTGLTDLLRKPKTPGFVDVLPDRKLGTVAKAFKQSFKKLVPYYAYNYVFWPMLAGPFWFKVLGGNLLADAMRNVFTAAVIYSGHFGDDTTFFPPDYRARNKGEWYRSQIQAAHNFRVPAMLSVLCGALDAQIEHHLFPKIPPNRLRKTKDKIRAICEKNGLAYPEASWWSTWKGALQYLWKMSSKPTSRQTVSAQAS